MPGGSPRRRSQGQRRRRSPTEASRKASVAGRDSWKNRPQDGRRASIQVLKSGVTLSITGQSAAEVCQLAPEIDGVLSTGAKLVAFIPCEDGSASYLMTQTLLAPGMILTEVNGESIRDMDFQDILMLCKWGIQDRGEEMGQGLSLTFNTPEEAGEAKQGKWRQKEMLSPGNRTSLSAPVTPQNRTDAIPPTSPIPVPVSPSPIKNFFKSGASRIFGRRFGSSTAVKDRTLAASRGTASSSKAYGYGHHRTLSEPQPGGERLPQQAIPMAPLTDHGWMEPSTEPPMSPRRSSFFDRKHDEPTDFSNKSLVELLNRRPKKDPDMLPPWVMEGIVWADWASPVVLKRMGARHALLLTRISIYVLEIYIKTEALNQEGPGVETDMVTGEARLVMRIEPPDLLTFLPYQTAVMADGSEVATRSSDIFLLSIEDKIYIWLRMESNLHRGELLECLDSWHRRWMESDLPFEQMTEAQVFAMVADEDLKDCIAEHLDGNEAPSLSPRSRARQECLQELADRNGKDDQQRHFPPSRSPSPKNRLRREDLEGQASDASEDGQEKELPPLPTPPPADPVIFASPPSRPRERLREDSQEAPETPPTQMIPERHEAPEMPTPCTPESQEVTGTLLAPSIPETQEAPETPTVSIPELQGTPETPSAPSIPEAMAKAMATSWSEAAVAASIGFSTPSASSNREQGSFGTPYQDALSSPEVRFTQNILSSPESPEERFAQDVMSSPEEGFAQDALSSPE
ncbi:unnamed protein product, partial [Chrysoparadoxa australica]